MILTKTLVVSPDAAEVERLSQLVASVGYPVSTVSSGEDALAFVRSHPPDIAIIDDCLPDMRGLELIRRMREEADIEDTGIILIFPSTVTDEECIRGWALHVDVKLVPPVPDIELLEFLRRMSKSGWVRERPLRDGNGR